MNTRVFTTGQVAKICNVAQKTVCNWFDRGELRGYRIPGSRDRRIPRDQLIRFLKAHNMPLDGLEESIPKVLMISCSGDLMENVELLLKDKYLVQRAADVFQAGVRYEQIKPDFVVIDFANEANAVDIVRHIDARVVIIAVVPEERRLPMNCVGRVKTAINLNTATLADNISSVAKEVYEAINANTPPD